MHSAMIIAVLLEKIVRALIVVHLDRTDLLILMPKSSVAPLSLKASSPKESWLRNRIVVYCEIDVTRSCKPLVGTYLCARQ